MNEFRIFACFKHPNILNCHEVYYYDVVVYALLDLMDGGSIAQLIHRYKRHYSENFCKYILYSVASGLKEMHKKNILHRDVKCDNILFNADGQIKISDLGFSVSLTNERSYRNTKLGTLGYFSPELISGKPYGKEVDIWAYGMIAYELAAG